MNIKLLSITLLIFSSIGIASNALSDELNQKNNVNNTLQIQNSPEKNYDYVFPENIHNYVAGTKVLQPKDNNIYECKPFPYSGFCVQWSPSANQYEPGVGFAWQEAWTLVTE